MISVISFTAHLCSSEEKKSRCTLHFPFHIQSTWCDFELYPPRTCTTFVREKRQAIQVGNLCNEPKKKMNFHEFVQYFDILFVVVSSVCIRCCYAIHIASLILNKITSMQNLNDNHNFEHRLWIRKVYLEKKN